MYRLRALPLYFNKAEFVSEVSWEVGGWGAGGEIPPLAVYYLLMLACSVSCVRYSRSSLAAWKRPKRF